jgi:hypothetical protein
LIEQKVAAVTAADTNKGLGLTIDNAGEWFNNDANMAKFETFINDGSLEKALAE